MTGPMITNSAGKIIPPPWLSGFSLKQGLDIPPLIQIRTFLTGLPNTGKTTFASSIPYAIHVDAEDSARYVPTPQPTSFRMSIQSGADYDKLVTSLVDNARKPGNPIKHVVIDTIDKMMMFILPWLTDVHNQSHPSKPINDIREYGQGGSGWSKVNEYVLSSLHRLYTAGYGWTVVGHLVAETVETGGPEGKSIAIVPAINQGIRTGIYRDVQFVATTTLRHVTSLKPVLDSSGNPTKTPAGTVITAAVREPRWMLELSTPTESRNPMTVMLKAKLMQYMDPEHPVDFTGPNGWSSLNSRYLKARDMAIADSQSIVPEPVSV